MTNGSEMYKKNGSEITNNIGEITNNAGAITNNASEITNNASEITNIASEITNNASEITNNATEIQDWVAPVKWNAKCVFDKQINGCSSILAFALREKRIVCERTMLWCQCV